MSSRRCQGPAQARSLSRRFDIVHKLEIAVCDRRHRGRPALLPAAIRLLAGAPCFSRGTTWTLVGAPCFSRGELDFSPAEERSIMQRAFKACVRTKLGICQRNLLAE